MKSWILAIALFAALPLSAAQADIASKNTEKTVGESIAYSLPVAAVTITLMHDDDWTGLKEYGFVAAATMGSTLLIRQFIHKTSPDGTSDRSFPSIEAAAGSPAESYLWRRYGWQYGLPAFILEHSASFLLDRAGKHHFVDGLAVSALSAGFSWLSVTPYHKRIDFGAYTDDRGGVYVGARMNF
jgi:hypothetical protein